MTADYLAPTERETTITSCDADDYVIIETAQRRYLGRLRRNPQFTEIASGFHGSTEWARFQIDADRWNPASGAKRRLSDEERARFAERARQNFGGDE